MLSPTLPFRVLFYFDPQERCIYKSDNEVNPQITHNEVNPKISHNEVDEFMDEPLLVQNKRMHLELSEEFLQSRPSKDLPLIKEQICLWYNKTILNNKALFILPPFNNNEYQQLIDKELFIELLGFISDKYSFKITSGDCIFILKKLLKIVMVNPN